MQPAPIKPHKNPALNPTYSQGILVGGFLYTSGQVGFDPAAKKLVEGGIEAETRQCLENIRAIIEAANGTMANIIKMNVYVSRTEDLAAMNKVYAQYFGGEQPPAKTAIACGGLAIGALVEMDAIAYLE